MAALAASTATWIPEDDLLLKNAVEAGASLEALAKGAVRFSRKYTLKELKDRWYSLLYDPIVSEEASARMVELERLPSNNLSRSGASAAFTCTGEVPRKRKVDSIRRIYYALKKRRCTWPTKSPNLSLQTLPKANTNIGDVLARESPVENFMLGNCIENHFEFQDVDADILHNKLEEGILIKKSAKHEVPEQGNACEDPSRILEETMFDIGNCPNVERMEASHSLPESVASIHSLGYLSPQRRTPLWETIEEISAPVMTMNVSNEDKLHVSEKTFILPDEFGEEKIIPGAVPESDLARLSDSLLNLENEDELNLVDPDFKDSIHNSCQVSAKPVVVDSPHNVLKDDVSNDKEPQRSLAIPDGQHDTELVPPVGQSESSNGNQHSICSSEVYLPPSKLSLNPQSLETLSEEVICTLNSEDTEIPCNSDFSSRKAVASSSLKTSLKKEGGLTSSFATPVDTEQKLSMTKKGKNPAQSFSAAKMGFSDVFVRTHHDRLLFTSGDKSESSDVDHPAGVPRLADSSVAGQGIYVAARTNPKTVTGMKGESIHACNALDIRPHGKSSSSANFIPKTEANLSTLEEEASSQQEEYDSDDDLPFFSDIESLILDMDLCPDGQDSGFSREVSRYQHEDTKKTIIRLEQCARSSMHREIAYRGALAVFYGRVLKYYIKKTEVIIGRATDDFDVDIDLGREGRANKISRRQALIKMEADGSFLLKNLGKNSMFLNGEEIATGQVQNLSSSSLIEIREMAFVFEMNHRSVRQYLENIARSKPEKNTTFEWSEEKAP